MSAGIYRNGYTNHTLPLAVTEVNFLKSFRYSTFMDRQAKPLFHEPPFQSAIVGIRRTRRHRQLLSDYASHMSQHGPNCTSFRVNCVHIIFPRNFSPSAHAFPVLPNIEFSYSENARKIFERALDEWTPRMHLFGFDSGHVCPPFLRFSASRPSSQQSPAP